MPVFTNPISSQNIATTGGINTYPQLGGIKQYSIFIDEFNRNSLNPTNAIAYYSTAADGTGSVTIVNNAYVSCLTDATLNDGAGISCSMLGMSRVSKYVDSRSQIIVDIIFSPGSTTNLAGAVGLTIGNTPPKGIPPTGTFLICEWDTTIDTHFHFQSRNNSTTVTTDTSQVIDNTKWWRLNITWTGDDSATLSLYEEPNFTTVLSSVNVTSILAGQTNDNPMFMIGTCATRTTAAKATNIQEWRVQVI